MRMMLSGFTLAVLILPLSLVGAEAPDSIAVTGEDLVATTQARGSQVYECKTDVSGKLAWQFREPIAVLFEDDRTVGRHFAGPTWELADGSTVMGRVSGRAPGATANDIPLLKLEVTSRHGDGQLSDISTIQRLNTKGGVAEGSCEHAGVLLSVPYSADYVFYKKKS
jgi:Protein of unknown function (DUF3455)